MVTTDGVQRRVFNTVALRVSGRSFCGIETVEIFGENAWKILGTINDGKLVVAHKEAVRGSTFDRLVELKGNLVQLPSIHLEPRTYFPQPTVLVRRDKVDSSPRSDFSVFMPFSTPSSDAQKELDVHCGSLNAKTTVEQTSIIAPPNPSMERTLPGQPVSASHVNR
jgi:hypothetical protein